MNFPTNTDITKLLEEQERKKRESESPRRMQFLPNFGDYWIQSVIEDILIEYPQLDKKTVKRIAILEEPIFGCSKYNAQFYNDELKIARLFNILQTIYGKNRYREEFDKAYQDIKETYESYKANFTDANIGEQPTTKIMILLKKFRDDDSIVIAE